MHDSVGRQQGIEDRLDPEPACGAGERLDERLIAIEHAAIRAPDLAGYEERSRSQIGAQTPGKPLREALNELGAQAVAASAPYSDNTSAAALRWRSA